MKYTLKISLFCALLFVSAASVCAQEKILVRGHVYSAMDKLPAVGATIMEMNTDNRVVSSTVTNLDGNFSLFVMSKKHSLVVSYVGYKKQTILIGDNLNMKIALQEGTHLQEITVVGKKNQAVGNLDINERDISMAIGKLTAEEIGDIQVASIDEAMQGRIAGVDIMANAGDRAVVCPYVSVALPQFQATINHSLWSTVSPWKLMWPMILISVRHLKKISHNY